MGKHLLCTQGVGGSNPPVSTNRKPLQMLTPKRIPAVTFLVRAFLGLRNFLKKAFVSRVKGLWPG